MKMPPPIATKFTKLVLTILAITIHGIILSFISQDHTLLILSAGVAVAGGVKIIDYRKKEDEVAKARRAKAEAEERAFCEEQNRLSEQAVQEAIRTIKDGGVLQNQTVKFYRSRYRCNAFSIVNYLMRKYGVNVPLRTQGWINDKLTSVTIENGKCEHLRYMRAKGAQCSQRFFDCMSELIHNVCAETEG